MIRITELKLPLEAVPFEVRRSADAPAETDADRRLPPHPIEALRQGAAQTLGVDPAHIAKLSVFKRSFDARKAQLQVVYIVDVALTSPASEAALLAKHPTHPHVGPSPDMGWHPPVQVSGEAVTGPLRPVVVGFGPCGMFAALVLAQMGLKPLVIERGKTVRQRTKDTWGLWRRQRLNAESHVQFGEGGAGTFSDGKLYSQIKDPRHLGRKVMQEFVRFGAPEDILFAAHPHIGTFKLVKVVEGLREEIIRLGQQTAAANSALRAGNIADAQKYAAQALELRKQSNPELYAGLNQYQQAAQGQVTSDLARLQQAQARQLSPEDLRNAQQAAREAYSARGLVMGKGAIGAEILNRDALARQREQEARTNLGTSMGQLYQGIGAQTANAFDPMAAVLGSQYGMQTQNVGLNQNLFNQSAGLAAGAYGNQYAQQMSNPFNPYAQDVYNTNFNAAAAKDIAAMNNAAAIEAARMSGNATTSAANTSFWSNLIGSGIKGFGSGLFGPQSNTTPGYSTASAGVSPSYSATVMNYPNTTNAPESNQTAMQFNPNLNPFAGGSTRTIQFSPDYGTGSIYA